MRKPLQAIFLACATFVAIPAAFAETPTEFLKAARFCRGVEAKFDFGSYFICIVVEIQEDGDSTLKSAAWNEDGSKNVYYLPNTSEIELLKRKMLELIDLDYRLPLKGTTLGIHCETVDLTIKRGLYQLHYEDILQESMHYHKFQNIYKVINSVLKRCTPASSPQTFKAQ